jgi:hypothetical protein
MAPRKGQEYGRHRRWAYRPQHDYLSEAATFDKRIRAAEQRLDKLKAQQQTTDQRLEKLKEKAAPVFWMRQHILKEAALAQLKQDNPTKRYIHCGYCRQDVCYDFGFKVGDVDGAVESLSHEAASLSHRRACGTFSDNDQKELDRSERCLRERGYATPPAVLTETVQGSR